MGVKTCKTCSKRQAKYGVLDNPEKKNVSKKNAHRNENNRKINALPEPEEGKYYISCMPKDYKKP